MHNISIRPVNAAIDSPAIAEIYGHYVTHTDISFEETPLTAEQMQQRVEEISATQPYFVAEECGQITGYCYVHPWKVRTAYSPTVEATVYLRKDSLGKGIGTLLMTTLINACAQRRIHTIIACITATNTLSINLVKRLGFKQASYFKEVGFKHNRRLDVVDYQLML